MKIKLIILFLLNTLFLWGQNKNNLIVEYTMIQDANDGNDSFNNYLISSENQNLYFQYGKINKSLDIDEVLNNFDLKKLDYAIKYKNPNDILESGWHFLPKLEFFEDNIPVINWKLLEGEKKILNYNCNSAQCTFRGRTYTVWYTTEIPLSFGPWKFSGLPGLILEAIDSKNMYNYYAIKVLQNYPLKIPEKLNLFLDKMDDNPISLKSYVKLQNDFLKELQRKNLANMPSGTVLVSNQNLREALKEIMFEWEVFPEKS